jgi:hypothetical protein
MVITVKKIGSKSELISEIQKIRMTKATVFEGPTKQVLSETQRRIGNGSNVVILIIE